MYDCPIGTYRQCCQFPSTYLPHDSFLNFWTGPRCFWGRNSVIFFCLSFLKNGVSNIHFFVRLGCCKSPVYHPFHSKPRHLFKIEILGPEIIVSPCKFWGNLQYVWRVSHVHFSRIVLCFFSSTHFVFGKSVGDWDHERCRILGRVGFWSENFIFLVEINPDSGERDIIGVVHRVDGGCILFIVKGKSER